MYLCKMPAVIFDSGLNLNFAKLMEIIVKPHLFHLSLPFSFVISDVIYLKACNLVRLAILEHFYTVIFFCAV